VYVRRIVYQDKIARAAGSLRSARVRAGACTAGIATLTAVCALRGAQSIGGFADAATDATRRCMPAGSLPAHADKAGAGSGQSPS
jgi:hypothetical protein